jgi:hypothetical protein
LRGAEWLQVKTRLDITRVQNANNANPFSGVLVFVNSLIEGLASLKVVQYFLHLLFLLWAFLLTICPVCIVVIFCLLFISCVYLLNYVCIEDGSVKVSGCLIFPDMVAENNEIIVFNEEDVYEYPVQRFLS